jgi:hypothetical protein
VSEEARDIAFDAQVGNLLPGSIGNAALADGAVTDAKVATAAAIAPTKIAGTAVVDSDARLTDQRVPTDGSVTDAKVDASAAIAGTKISPNFGSQPVSTTGGFTGSLTGNASTATTLQTARNINGVPFDGSANITITANIDDNTVTSAKIVDGAIVNADVNASAGIAASKLSFTQAGSGATARTIDSKLKDVVSVKDFGAVGDGVVNDTAAIQAAINSTNSQIIFFPPGNYRINATLNFSDKSQHLMGSGQEKTKITAEHTTGAAIRSKYQYSKITGLLIQSNPTRAATAHTAKCFGIHLETDDLPDSASLEMRNCYIADCVIIGQTGAGIYTVGPRLDGTAIERCRIFNNNAHGIAADRGHLGGRTNLGLSMGVSNINNCLFFGNTGHAIALGHPSDTQSSQTVRWVINNCDCNCQSLSSAVAYQSSPMHGICMRGSNNVLADSVVTSNTNTLDVAVHVEGNSNFIRNLRAIRSRACVQVGPTFTDGCTIEGLWPIQFAQPHAVLLNTIGTGKNVNIIPRNRSGFTSLVNTRQVEWLSIVLPSTDLVLTSNSVVNNSTTLVDVSTELRYYLAPNERVKFFATLYYVGTDFSDIRFTIQGPSSPVAVIFGVPQSGKFNVSGVWDTSIPNTAFGAVENANASTTARTFTLVGYVTNGANAGWLRPQFAQNTAQAVNTTVRAGSTFTISPCIY